MVDVSGETLYDYVEGNSIQIIDVMILFNMRNMLEGETIFIPSMFSEMCATLTSRRHEAASVVTSRFHPPSG